MNHSVGTARGHETQRVEHGQSGEGAAHVTPGEGRSSLWVLNELLTHKVPSNRTGGAYALFEVITHPGLGPPPHVHHREDEAIYVLEGEYEFLVDGHTLKAGAGSLLYIPKGTLHAHENVGEGLGRMLLTYTPGGLYELFFEKAGIPVDGDDGRPPVLEDRLEAGRRIVELASEYGTEIPSLIVA